MSAKPKDRVPGASEWAHWNSQLAKFGLSKSQRESIIGKNPNSQSREVSAANMLIWQRSLPKGSN